VIKGTKTEKEKFPGGEFTTTIEAYVPAHGRGIQAGTSHHLGQNFSKMFEIVYEDPNESGAKKYVYQNSWGLTTRSIGVMIMVHADDKGLVLPPRVASIQVVIVPCGITATTSDKDRNHLLEECKKLEAALVGGGVSVKSDLRDNYSPGWKYNHYELKGVPIRVELGPKDLQKNQFVAVRRDTGVKSTLGLNEALKSTQDLLQDIQSSMLSKARKEMEERVVTCFQWADFVTKLEEKNIIIAPFCGDVDCEENIKKDSAKEDVATAGAPLMGAKSLCIPSDRQKEITSDMKCIHNSCKSKPKFFTLFGRSY
jgi:bifunctional glutamyl/prolyl-tRNA synthetase